MDIEAYIKQINNLEEIEQRVSQEKILEWLACKPMEEDYTRLEWIKYCMHWELEIYGGINEPTRRGAHIARKSR